MPVCMHDAYGFIVTCKGSRPQTSIKKRSVSHRKSQCERLLLSCLISVAIHVGVPEIAAALVLTLGSVEGTVCLFN